MNLYRLGWKQAITHPDASVHHTAEIGNIPESRDMIAEWRKRGPLLHQTSSYGMYFPVVVGPNAIIGPHCVVDGGTKHNTVVNGWLMAGAHLGHDVRVEEGAEVGGGCEIGGHVRICEGAMVKMRVTVLHELTIGANAYVGAGSVVTKDVPAGQLWYGSPARFVRWRDGFEPDSGVEGVSVPDRDLWLEQFNQGRYWQTAPFPTEQEIAEHLYGPGAKA